MKTLSNFFTANKTLNKIKEIAYSYKVIDKIYDLLIDDYINENLYKNHKYSDIKKLNGFEFQVFSQSGEDGIIAEIFNRIGTTNKHFVEFGVGNGLENNTTYLLTQSWSGYWIEGNKKFIKEIQMKFAEQIHQRKIILTESFITAENIESLFKDINISNEFDLLSVDIDRNDYWVWKAITNYSPRVVVIEYNALFPPHVKWVVEYNPNAVWNGTSHFNSSLKSLEILARLKGYSLVGCSFTGVNAFFVRDDLLGDKFCQPFTSENHYEPLRYFLNRKIGHPRDIGNFLNI